jgi:hypothetical protein
LEAAVKPIVDDFMDIATDFFEKPLPIDSTLVILAAICKLFGSIHAVDHEIRDLVENRLKMWLSSTSFNVLHFLLMNS